jgi:hypothetical protein
MDYSLLLGVHYRTNNYFSSPPVTDKVSDLMMQNGVQSQTELGRVGKAVFLCLVGAPPARPSILHTQTRACAANPRVCFHS